MYVDPVLLKLCWNSIKKNHWTELFFSLFYCRVFQASAAN